jgi:hypothetical protein
MFSISNCRRRSYGRRKDSEEKHSSGSDARKRRGGVRAGVMLDGRGYVGCVAARGRLNADVES